MRRIDCKYRSGSAAAQRADSPFVSGWGPTGSRRSPRSALISTLLCLILLFSGCKSRTPPSSTVEPEAPSTPVPTTSSQAPELPSEPEIEYINDPEQLSQALEIVSELLDRAEDADDFYRGAVLRDGTINTERSGIIYYLVIDERLSTYDDLQEFLDNTFIKGGIAADRFEKMRLTLVYISENGQLHAQADISPSPLTLGRWDISSIKLISFSEELIEVSMDTTLAGQPNGQQTLSIVNRNGIWLLDDNYFLD